MESPPTPLDISGSVSPKNHGGNGIGWNLTGFHKLLGISRRPRGIEKRHWCCQDVNESSTCLSNPMTCWSQFPNGKMTIFRGQMDSEFATFDDTPDSRIIVTGLDQIQWYLYVVHNRFMTQTLIRFMESQTYRRTFGWTKVWNCEFASAHFF